MLLRVVLHVERAVIHHIIAHAYDLDARAARTVRPAAGTCESSVGIHTVDAQVVNARRGDVAHDVDLARAIARNEERHIGDAQILAECFHEDCLRLVQGHAFHLDAADVGKLDVAVDTNRDVVDADAVRKTDCKDVERIALEEAIARRRFRTAQGGNFELLRCFYIVLRGHLPFRRLFLRFRCALRMRLH